MKHIELLRPYSFAISGDFYDGYSLLGFKQPDGQLSMELDMGYDRPFALAVADLMSMAQHVRVEHVEELIKRVKKLPWSEDKGVDGCTFGDTEYSSIDVCYGYNLAIEQIRAALGDIMEKIEVQ